MFFNSNIWRVYSLASECFNPSIILFLVKNNRHIIHPDGRISHFSHRAHKNSKKSNLKNFYRISTKVEDYCINLHYQNWIIKVSDDINACKITAMCLHIANDFIPWNWFAFFYAGKSAFWKAHNTFRSAYIRIL